LTPAPISAKIGLGEQKAKMKASALKRQFESALGGPLDWQSRPTVETVSTGIAEIDRAIGGLPRGCLTEIVGSASSGRTSLLTAMMAAATERQETCALVDADDAFHPVSAEAAGVELNRVLWIRCGHDAGKALKVADLLTAGGGFGLVAVDLGDTPPATARRIPLNSWFRLRRAVEHTPTALVALGLEPNAKTCASLLVECARQGAAWSGAQRVSRMLDGMSIQVARRKPSVKGAAHVLLPVR
jgi:recombination protein RecA